MAQDKLTYVDYMADAEKFNQRLGFSYVDFDKMLAYFNISRLPDYENAAEPYLSYIFMSRPSLYVADSSIAGADSQALANLTALKNNAMASAFSNDKYGDAILKRLSEYSSNPWLPLFTTKAMSYAVSDFELKTVEKGNTYFGHVIKYGKHSEEHKAANTISIDFRNDRYLSIIKMVYLWMVYIYQVSKNGSIVPSDESQQNGILDYAGSIYYLVTRRNGSELVYWEKLVGVFPIRCPFSIFSSNDSVILEDKVSIDFQYCIKADPCDPSILMDINYLSGDSITTINNKTRLGHYSHQRPMGEGAQYEQLQHILSAERFINNKETPFVKGDVFAVRPYITVQKDSQGRLKYYLQWEGTGAPQPIQTTPDKSYWG